MNKMGKKPSELNVAIKMKAVFAKRNWNSSLGKLSTLFQGGKWRSKDEM